MWEGKNEAVYWNVFVVSSHPGYSTFLTSPIITDRHTAGRISLTAFLPLYIVILWQPHCTVPNGALYRGKIDFKKPTPFIPEILYIERYFTSAVFVSARLHKTTSSMSHLSNVWEQQTNLFIPARKHHQGWSAETTGWVKHPDRVTRLPRLKIEIWNIALSKSRGAHDRKKIKRSKLWQPVVSRHAAAFATLLARRLILLKWKHTLPPSYDRWIKEGFLFKGLWKNMETVYISYRHPRHRAWWVQWLCLSCFFSFCFSVRSLFSLSRLLLLLTIITFF